MNWTLEQEAILDWFAHGTGDLVVNARAGCTKTTTVLEGTHRAPEALKIVTAFNARIAKELQERIGEAPGVQARTLHSLARGYCMRKLGRVNVEDRRKTPYHELRGPRFARTAWQQLRAIDGDFPKLPGHNYLRLAITGAAKTKNIAPFAKSIDDVMPILEQFNLIPTRAATEETRISGYVIAEVVLEAMKLARRDFKTVDFDDMMFLPIVEGWVTPAFDLICVDESQDLNPLQIELCTRALKPSGRFAVIGDAAQRIYGFMGANSDPLHDALAARGRTTTLTLNTTFRCPREIVTMAQAYVPDFVAAPHVPPGVVADLKYHDCADLARDGDFILSRFNAPLIALRLDFLSAGKPAQIVGAEAFAKALEDLIILCWPDDQSMRTFYKNLRKWAVDNRAGNLDESGEGDPELMRETNEWNHGLVEGVQAIARYAIDGMPAKHPGEVLVRFKQIFGDTDTDAHGPQLSTIHKAKGREASRVFLLEYTLWDGNESAVPCIKCHHRRWLHDAKGEACHTCRAFEPDVEWTQQERNLAYVAITRAKRELYMVQAPPTKVRAYRVLP